MKNKILFLVLFTIISLSAFSQGAADCHISGHVKSVKDAAFLPDVNIVIKGTTIGTSTDATGHYFLKNVPAGKYTIVASEIGYKSQEKVIDLTQKRNLEVDFNLADDEMLLGTVVVSSSRNATSRKEASTIVNLITPKIFASTNSVCLAQSLDYMPGLRTETNCENCGLEQVRINGLDGNYSQILIDSRPIYSALQSVYGIEQIPTNMIQRVEVVRGGGSAIFGSNAIGGTINIITKDPSTNSASVSNNTTMIGGKTPDVTSTFDASVVSDDNKAGLMFFGSSRSRNPYDNNGDGYSEITKFKDFNIGFKGYYRTSDYSKLTLEYHNLYNFLRGGNDFDSPVQLSDLAEEAQYYINTGSLNYDLYSRDNKQHFNVYTSGQVINRTNYAGTDKDPNGFGKTDGKTFVAGAQYTYNFDKLLFMPSELTAGTEYKYDGLHDEIVGYNRKTDQELNIESLYLQNEWKNKKFGLLIGARMDKHSLVEKPIISPRMNIRYNPNDVISVRASYATGFRAPQVYDEDLHGSAIGGEISFVENAPNLKPETSNSLTASIDFTKKFGTLQTELLIEGFYTNLNHIFAFREIADNTDGTFMLERYNASGAVVKGINFEGKIVPSANLQFQLGLTVQNSEYNKAEQWSDDASIAPQKKMFRTPDNYGYLTMDYDVTKKMEFSLNGTYTGSMLLQHYAGYISQDEEVSSPQFFDLGAKISYNFELTNSAKLQLSGGIKNIFNSYQRDFDQGVERDAAYIYGPKLPRSIVIGLKLSI